MGCLTVGTLLLLTLLATTSAQGGYEVTACTRLELSERQQDEIYCRAGIRQYSMKNMHLHSCKQSYSAQDGIELALLVVRGREALPAVAICLLFMAILSPRLKIRNHTHPRFGSRIHLSRLLSLFNTCLQSPGCWAVVGGTLQQQSAPSTVRQMLAYTGAARESSRVPSVWMAMYHPSPGTFVVSSVTMKQQNKEPLPLTHIFGKKLTSTAAAHSCTGLCNDACHNPPTSGEEQCNTLLVLQWSQQDSACSLPTPLTAGFPTLSPTGQSLDSMLEITLNRGSFGPQPLTYLLAGRVSGARSILYIFRPRLTTIAQLMSAKLPGFT
jgi:hypothetical protein